MLQKIKMELVVKNEDLERVLAIIIETAKSEDVGDGKIFIYDVADAIRIRTGERGQQALQYPDDIDERRKVTEVH